ncbi:MAG: hypothetical protein HUJ54_14755 [Erysipelotrichaceae bacterium]|nr:hypothetical protein [Erysipelotrichaceae bacterium]
MNNETYTGNYGIVGTAFYESGFEEGYAKGRAEAREFILKPLFHWLKETGLTKEETLAWAVQAFPKLSEEDLCSAYEEVVPSKVK